MLQRFDEAAERVKTLTKRPTDMELLELYGLFKQATIGDNNTSEFLFYNFNWKLHYNNIFICR